MALKAPCFSSCRKNVFLRRSGEKQSTFYDHVRFRECIERIFFLSQLTSGLLTPLISRDGCLIDMANE